jgi:hypothetical protein
LTLKWFKNWSNFDKTKDKKVIVTKGPNYFTHSAAEYFASLAGISWKELATLILPNFC